MKKNDRFPFGGEENLTMDRVANLLIPLMSAIYSKQQLANLEGEDLSLSEAFRTVVKDIFTLSTEIIQLDRVIQENDEKDDPTNIN